MNRLFGSKSSAPKPSLNEAVANIDNRVASLDVKLAKINGELGTYQQKMSRMRDGPGKNALKQKALKLLKQRKMIEAQKDQLQNQSFNMEQAVMTTDNLRNTMATVDAMKTANKEIKKQYGKINIDKIESMQDEMADLLDMSQELQDTMSRNYAVPDDIDEGELDAELEALGEEMEYEVLHGTGESEAAPSYLDDVPSFVDEPVQENKEEQKAAETAQ
ncbi:hypothetical protein TRICI_002246 [Trichomonascus ciferrii]|uniref:Charged multivesicular body protein 5 n=1 Tax=Trichomonascus ciferrii TaxID=44093 RepID=A0A642VBV8_9ASCO|nr:hypothetical protein TRICI_002246 [Trichomonascus ciferrii]